MNIATRWFGAPYFQWNGYGVRRRVVGSVQNRVLVWAIVVGLDGECACCGGCVSEHGRWQSGGVVLVSVGLGSDRPFEISLADVVKAMESAKAIIREDVQRGGGGRRSDQCCLVHATDDVWVESDAIGKAESPRRSGEVKWCSDARAVHRECFHVDDEFEGQDCWEAEDRVRGYVSSQSEGQQNEASGRVA